MLKIMIPYWYEELSEKRYRCDHGDKMLDLGIVFHCFQDATKTCTAARTLLSFYSNEGLTLTKNQSPLVPVARAEGPCLTLSINPHSKWENKMTGGCALQYCTAARTLLACHFICRLITYCRGHHALSRIYGLNFEEILDAHRPLSCASTVKTE